jgi:hypothetical protein
MPMQAAPRITRASTVEDEHVAAPGLLGRGYADIKSTLAFPAALSS